MLVLAVLAFPVVLLLLMLAMERVERPLRRDAIGQELAAFLDSAHPEEIETYVSEGYAAALEHYWRRRARAARLPRPRRVRRPLARRRLATRARRRTPPRVL